MADLFLNDREIITHYFHLGYPNEVIREFLSQYHDITISLRTLKRRLRDFGLRRNGNYENNEDRIRQVITEEISNGSGASLGYRSMWHLLRLQYHIHVPRRFVAQVLREVDPEGVQQRQRRRLSRRRYTSYGPNFCWHIDGYDKLKPYGFPIHGAIDGYSRKILWLELVRSNNKPEVPARFYLDCVNNNEGCPMLVRSDCGTENGIIAGMQCYLRKDGDDIFSGNNAHKYGTSPANQRIESWWSYFRRARTGWWMDFFKDMVSSGLLEIGNILHMECLWFCFQPVLSSELDAVKAQWNTHRIRQTRNYGTVSGVPDVLYYLPQRSGAIECKCRIRTQQIEEMEPRAQCELESETLEIYREYFNYVMENENLRMPTNAAGAFELFQRLIEFAYPDN